MTFLTAKSSWYLSTKIATLKRTFITQLKSKTKKKKIQLNPLKEFCKLDIFVLNLLLLLIQTIPLRRSPHLQIESITHTRYNFIYFPFFTFPFITHGESLFKLWRLEWGLKTHPINTLRTKHLFVIFQKPIKTS